MTAGSPSASRTGVWVLGGYQTDFARNLTREGATSSDLVGEVVDGTLEATPRRPRPTSRSSTSATPSASCSPARATSAPCRRRSAPDLWGVPAARHEAACASGGIAVLAAMAELEAGRYDVRPRARRRAGAHRPRRPGRRAPRRGGVGRATRARARTFMWPHVFCAIADEYDRRYGLDDAHLRAIAELNLAQRRGATRNAQTRGWDVPDRTASGDRRRRQPGRRGPRSAATTAARSPTAAPAWSSSPTRGCATTPARRRPRRRASLGWGHRTVGLGAATRSSTATATSPTSCRTCAGPSPTRSDRAGVALEDARRHRGARLLHADRVPGHRPPRAHRPGRVVEGRSRTARIERGGRCRSTRAAASSAAATPSGATGVRMLLDAAKQVTGTAGDYQVEGARTLRHAQHRRQHRHHRQPRRRRRRRLIANHCERGDPHGRRDRRSDALDPARGRRPPVPHRRRGGRRPRE